MSRQLIYKGSDFELTLQIIDKAGAPVLVSTVVDILVLIEYKNGTGGALVKFKKVAADLVLAWTPDIDDTSAILCVVPADVISDAKEGDLTIGVKVKTADGHSWTEILEHEIVIKDNALADD